MASLAPLLLPPMLLLQHCLLRHVRSMNEAITLLLLYQSG